MREQGKLSKKQRSIRVMRDYEKTTKPEMCLKIDIKASTTPIASLLHKISKN